MQAGGFGALPIVLWVIAGMERLAGRNAESGEGPGEDARVRLIGAYFAGKGD